MQLEAEIPVMQCGHIGNSNTSGSGRSQVNINSDSDSASELSVTKC